jgi:hypothetical protein
MKKIIIKFIGAALCSAQFFSCDILRNDSFEVSAWTPGAGIKDEIITSVSLSFSQSADKTSAERAFSFTEDGENVKGTFSWSDKCLTFYPASPLAKNRDYELILGTEAKSVDGLSLEERFSGIFSTRTDGERPLIISILPPDESLITDTWAKVFIRFSIPVDLLSCINDISFTPAINGSWHLEDDNLKAVFNPVEQWVMGETYKINIESFFQSAGGKMLGHSETARWMIGDDKTPPALLEITAVDSNGINVFPLTKYDSATASPFVEITENVSWESDYGLKITFNEDINTDKIKNLITIIPALKYEINPSYGYSDSVAVIFTEKPEWKSRFDIKINSGITDRPGNKSLDSFTYKIYADGKNSMPPELVAIRLPENPQDYSSTNYALFKKENIFELFNIDVAEFEISTWIELYFDTAPEADIDLFSIMDLFKVTATNSALSFLPVRVIDNNFTVSDPDAGYKNKKRVEIQGVLSNTVDNGIVTFSVCKGLLDTKQNKNAKEMEIMVLK